MNSDVPEKGRRDVNARLRELLAIPERLRTDEQWDEILEIEISQGPTKPTGNPSRSAPRDPTPRQGNPTPRQGRKPPGAGKQLRKRRP
jgi:hypothetical protein